MCHLSNNIFRFSSKIAPVGISHKLPLQLHKTKSLHFGWSLLGGWTILLCVLLTGNQGSMFILLFWDRLSEKVHAAMPKVIMCGFVFNVLQRNLQEWQWRPWTYVCESQRKATRVGLTATVSGTGYWSYTILPCRIVASTNFSDNLSQNSYMY